MELPRPLTPQIAPRELVGQRFVVAFQGERAPPALLRRIRAGEVGGVILFGANIRNRSQLRSLTETLQRAARNGGRPRLLVAVDQEGGEIRRVSWVGPRMAAAELGRESASRIRREARVAGVALRAGGINVDLAPVADVPIGESFLAAEGRTFSGSASSVTRAVNAFAEGLDEARVAAVAKHFPGIGRATRNTDRSEVSIDVREAALERDLAPFRSAIAAGIPLVMISNATYPALDAKPAPWSPRIQSLLRNKLGYEGVTISDALEGAASTRKRALASVAVLAAQAGVDLLLFTGTEASSAAAFERVARAAEAGRVPAASLRRSYERVLKLKRAYG